jgi:hypothetical protein
MHASLAPRLAAVAVLLSSVAACGDGDDPAPPSGWVEVPGMICADGSPTGIGISPGSENRVLVFLNGGGACWSETACDASPGPFGRTEYQLLSAFTTGTIFDRSLPGNPFADWTLVFVPYCTGDVHAGDSEQDYGTAGTWRHQGRANLEAALEEVVAALPVPDRVVIGGWSAGGFGSLLAFDVLRARWPAGGAGAAQAYLVDDSGPTLVGEDLPATLRSAWWTSWNLAETVTPLCPECEDDLSAIWASLSADHPQDRFALLTTTQDATMRGFFGGMDAGAFETAIGTLTEKLDGLANGNAASFTVGGAGATDHALLVSPQAYSANGTSLLRWLELLVTDDPAWTSVGP